MFCLWQRREISLFGNESLKVVVGWMSHRGPINVCSTFAAIKWLLLRSRNKYLFKYLFKIFTLKVFVCKTFFPFDSTFSVAVYNTWKKIIVNIFGNFISCTRFFLVTAKERNIKFSFWNLINKHRFNINNFELQTSCSF